MSFRIGKHTTLLANGFRTALCGQAKRAIKDLGLSAKKPVPEGIHDARKRIKKIRAVLRLLEASGFSKVTETDYNLLRDASAEIAPARNADANTKALKKLCGHFDSDRLRFSKTFDLLEKKNHKVFQAAPAAMHRAVTYLKAVHSRIEAWEAPPVTWKEVRSGLRRVYKRSREAFRTASDEISVENFHQWRKRAVELYLNLKLIESVDSKNIRPFVKQARKICALLGEEHDLAMMRMTVGQTDLGKEMKIIDKLTAARRRKLQCKALEYGSEFFAEKPKEFVAKIDS